MSLGVAAVKRADPDQEIVPEIGRDAEVKLE
jgi:hypothetical protein